MSFSIEYNHICLFTNIKSGHKIRQLANKRAKTNDDAVLWRKSKTLVDLTIVDLLFQQKKNTPLN